MSCTNFSYDGSFLRNSTRFLFGFIYKILLHWADIIEIKFAPEPYFI